MNQMQESIEQAIAAQMEPIDAACQAVLELGYTATDCVIERHDLENGIDRRDVLVVHGVPVFEVVTRYGTFEPVKNNGVTVDYGMQITVTPKMLKWPGMRRV